MVSKSERDFPRIKEEIYEFIRTSSPESKPYCFKIGAQCSKEILINPKQVFVGMPFKKKFEKVYRLGISAR